MEKTVKPEKVKEEMSKEDKEMALKRAKINEAADVMSGLELLDDLIRVYYIDVMVDLRNNFKAGDFARMVELRYKLSPTEFEQRKFWAALANIRREVLKEKEALAGKEAALKKIEIAAGDTIEVADQAVESGPPAEGDGDAK